MNILFVNYGDFTTNSLNHIGGFANTLCGLGHACIVAVPEGLDTLKVVDRPVFIPALFEELLREPRRFPDGRAADVIHVWTPRENVRRFAQAYLGACQPDTKLFIHLEDNEDFLIESFTGKSLTLLRQLSANEAQEGLPTNLPHPLLYRDFLALADGVTVIIDRLREFVPTGIPVHLLQPGVDFRLYSPGPAPAALREKLALAPEEIVLTFTGSTTFANEPEMRELYVAVAALNAEGIRTRLLRTGFSDPRFLASLTENQKAHVLDLGFVPKAELPDLLRLADVLVQPGRPGAFNDYRLPSKLPEFLASGRPVIMPATNVALQLRPGVECLALPSAHPEAVVQAVKEVLADRPRAERLARAAAVAAERLFSLPRNTGDLIRFYHDTPQRTTHDALPSLARLAAFDRLRANNELLSQKRQWEEKLFHAEKGLREHREVAESTSLRLSLTGQHVENLNAQVHHLRGELESTRRHHDQIEKTLETVQNSLTACEVRLALANKRATETELVAREKVEELHRRLDELKAELQQREAKIRRMQQTFSWQATAPLRELRRWFIDPWRRKTLVAAATPAFPLVAERAAAGEPTAVEPQAAEAPRRYSYTFNIDHPRSWNTTSNRLLLLGWCFENEGAAISGVRVRIGDTLTEGAYGSKRLDVLASVGGRKQAEFCGVKVDAKLTLGEFPLSVEVKHGETWHSYFQTTLHVGKPGDPMELSEYEKWCQQHETLSDEDRAAVQRHIAGMAQPTRFSVIVPVYNPPLPLFKKAIASVEEQLYPHWELCLADDASTDQEVRAYLAELAAKQDPRFRVVFREKNGHISQATNSALALATGDFVVLFDHDDVLHAQALYECAAALEKKPDLSFLYTDEDKIDGEDRRFDPYFKPDWNPDLLHGQNYTSHLSVFRRSLIEKLGGMRIGFEGSQDWDLTLRVVDAIPEAAIHHIPRVLYHWRAIPGSTALQLSEKNYPLEAARKALGEHFARRGVDVTLRTVPGDHWHIQYALPAQPPKVSLIIPTRNAKRLVQQAIESILGKTAYPNYEVLLVDNGSDDAEALAYFADLPRLSAGRVRVLRYDAPFNYSAINNHAVEHSDGPLIGLINNDIEVINPEWLSEMVSLALRPGTGAVGAMLYYPNNTVQHAGVVLGLGGVAGHAFKEFPRGEQGQKNRLRLVQNYSAVTAACLIVTREAFLAVGGLDAKNLAVAFNDVDLCCKLLKAGYRNVWTPHAELFHHESATRGIEDTPAKMARFQSEVDYMMSTWGDLLQHDPAYNPNLTLVGEDFSPAYLPRLTKAWSAYLAPKP